MFAGRSRASVNLRGGNEVQLLRCNTEMDYLKKYGFRGLPEIVTKCMDMSFFKFYNLHRYVVVMCAADLYAQVSVY